MILISITSFLLGDVWSKLHNAYLIWTGGGMTLQVY